MKKGSSVLRKSFTILMWIFLSVFLLLIAAALVIQFPSVQNKLIQFATSQVSDKTGTKVELGQIAILFPKSVSLQDLYIEDRAGDTLLYAGHVGINADLIALLSGDIHFRSVTLEDITGKVSNSETDSILNYNFLLEAFTDTTAAESENKEEQPAGKKGDFAIDNVYLKNVNLLYDDQYNGMYAAAQVEKLEMKLKKLDFDKQQYDVKDLDINTLSAKVQVTKAATSGDTSQALLPHITAERLNLNNVNIQYTDQDGQDLGASVAAFIVDDADVDLAASRASISSVRLENSKLAFSHAPDTVSSSDTVQSLPWSVKVDEIDLQNNAIAYHQTNARPQPTGFDPAHINLSAFTMTASDLVHSASLTKVQIKNCFAKNGDFALKKLAVQFSMHSDGINAKDIKVETSASHFYGNAGLKYHSTDSFILNPGHATVNASVSESYLSLQDVFYFNDELRSQPYLSNISYIKYSGQLTGRVNDIHGKNILLATGEKTVVRTSLNIKGLPDANSLWLDIPRLTVHSGKKDLEKILGREILPDSMQLPDNIVLTASFTGTQNDFSTDTRLTTDYGAIDAKAEMKRGNHYNARVSILDFDFGRLMNDRKTFGPVTLTATVDGSGLDTNTVDARLSVTGDKLYFNEYAYSNLTIDGRVVKKMFEGNINLNDTNAVFDFAGLVNLNSGEEQFKFTLDVKGADLNKLHFTEDDIRIGLMAVADLKGSDVNSINGTAGITQLLIAKHGNKYLLDSILFASVNENGRSELDLQSAIVGIKYKGTFAPGQLADEIKNHINIYFPIDTTISRKDTLPQHFNFEIHLRNHPLIADVFLPSLTEFEPGIITGEYNSEQNVMKLSANINRITYDSLSLREAGIAINSSGQSLDYAITCTEIRNPQIRLQHLAMTGSAKDKAATIHVECADDDKEKLLALSGLVSMENDYYLLKLDPSALILAKKRWNIPEDNSIAFGSQGMRIDQFVLTSDEESLSVQSVNKKFNDDLSINIRSLKLHDIADIMKKDVTLISGILNGDINLKPVRNTYGFTADASITDLALREIPAGNLAINASNPETERYALEVNLTGNENDVRIAGDFIPLDSTGKLDFQIDIKNLAMTTVEAFSMGNISNSAGNLNGSLSITGTTDNPEPSGSVTLVNAYANPALLNNRLYFQDETIRIDKKGIYINQFTVKDENGNDAVVDGSVLMPEKNDYQFNLTASTNDFQLFNTTREQNKEYYGKMIIDSRINITGDANLPVVSARLKLKEGSDFTFAVPEEKLTADKGEGVVLFVDSLNMHPIITRNEETEKQKSELQGFDIRTTIEVDRNAVLKLMIDPTTTDSLVVQGDAALSFAIDPSGKMSLTGNYNLTEGSYLVSLQSLIRKKFEIEEGSTITWNGDVLDATVDIRAIYTVRTSPIDLVADQMSGLSETDRNSFRMRLPFLVYLKLTGSLMLPEISFEIQLPAGDKGALGGAVNTKLQMLNDDPSALNKQVFALLVLGRFIQENPLESETDAGLSAMARTSVSKFLSHQLTRLGAKALPGVELSFDVQSYDDYTSGQAESRTEVGIGLEKQLFDDRVSVQVGGTVDVEGERARQNNASDITGDVTVEYKLTEDGRYRLRGFRHNEYEGALEGQLVETGVGFVYTRDFNRWKNFFKLTRREKRERENEER